MCNLIGWVWLILAFAWTVMKPEDELRYYACMIVANIWFAANVIKWKD